MALSKTPASSKYARRKKTLLLRNCLALAVCGAVASLAFTLLAQTPARYDPHAPSTAGSTANAPLVPPSSMRTQAQGPSSPSLQQQRPRRAGSVPPASPQPKPEAPPAAQRPTQAAKPTTAAGEEVDEGDVVRVETQLVSVPVAVTDQTNHPLLNLRAENFIVYEDNRVQRVSNFSTADAPFEVALLLDTSGSTRAEVALIRRAANAFIDALRANDRVAILAFNTAAPNADPFGTSNAPPQRLAQVETLTALTSDRAQLRSAIDSIGASNGTPFYDALVQVADSIFREAPRREMRGRRAVVALTDGVDSTSDEDFATARERLTRIGVATYFIEVNTEDFVEERLMKDCADDQALTLSRAQLRRYRKIFAPHADASDYSSFCRLGQFERMDISRQLYKLARDEMAELARASGGKTYAAEDLRDARQAFAEVARLIGTQYSLGYYPTNKTRDGRFRRIRVELRGTNPGAQVSAREGYYAPQS